MKTNNHDARRRLFARRPFHLFATSIGITCLAAFGIALATAGADSSNPGNFVTDPQLGITLPAAKEAVLQARRSHVNLPESSAPAPPTPQTPPAPVPPTIRNASAAGVPFSPDLLRPTNAYFVGDTSSLTEVYAGADGQDPTRGLIVVLQENYAQGTEQIQSYPSPGTGALTIASVTAGKLNLASDTGKHAVFDTTRPALGVMLETP
jgi:hypothetical protein